MREGGGKGGREEGREGERGADLIQSRIIYHSYRTFVSIHCTCTLYFKQCYTPACMFIYMYNHVFVHVMRYTYMYIHVQCI